MAGSIDIHAETLRGYVMHDLGELSSKRKTPPQLRDARRFAAARASELGVPADQIEVVAKAAVKDWRATHRAQELPESSPIAKSYLTGPPSGGVVGVRVVFAITYPAGKPPGAKDSASIVMNVLPSMSIEDIKAQAINAWNSHSVEVTHGHRSGGIASSAEIVQIVLGGFAQADI